MPILWKVIKMVSEKKKEPEEQTLRYEEYLQNTINKLDEVVDTIDAMVKFCSFGEPEFYGSKAMKFFFQNLSDLNRNGRSFLYEMQDEIEYNQRKRENMTG